MSDMSLVKFPKRRTDGSFCLEIVLPVVTSDPDALLRRVQDWTVRWVKANEVWTRKWQPSGEELLRYHQEFKREPRPVSCSLTELRIQLEGKPSAKWWKDWMVLRIIHDLSDAFTEIQSGGRVTDCNEVGRGISISSFADDAI
jgi:hypothetical protein